MLHSDKMTIKWRNNTKRHFEELGYKFTKLNDEFEINVSDLSLTSTMKIKLICDNVDCKEAYEISYRDYCSRKNPNIEDLCKNCKRRSGQPPSDLLLQQVCLGFKEKGYSISNIKDYKTHNSPLKFTCDKHEHDGVQTTTWRILNSDKESHQCTSCSSEKRKREHKEILTMKDNRDYLANFLGEKELVYVFDRKYESLEQPIEFTCSIHEHKGTQFATLKNISRRIFPCRYCMLEHVSESRIGSKGSQWKGGLYRITTWLRQSKFMKAWRIASLESYSHKCAITGVKDNIEVHHPYALNKMIVEAFNDLDLDYKDSVKKYEDSELLSILKYIKVKHEKIQGIPLTKEVHDLYHKVYKYDNTYEQFEEFQSRFNNGEFETLFLMDKTN